MSARDLPSPAVLKRLVTVIHTRLSSAESALQREMGSLRKIEQELEERQDKVNSLNEDIVDLQQFFEGVCPQSHGPLGAVDYESGLKRRFWIDYDLQREHYYLEMTHEEHAEQLKKVAEARKLCKALKYKHDTLLEKLLTAKVSRDAARTRKQDAERQDIVRHPTY